MKDNGYYEIDRNHVWGKELKAGVIVGNVRFNRLHWHEHLEILCCVHGSFCIRAEGEVCRLSEGDIFTINCGISHEIFDGTADGLQIIISIDPSLLHKEEDEIYIFSTVGSSAVFRESEEVRAVRSSMGKMAWLFTTEIEKMVQLSEVLKKAAGFNVLKNEEEWNCFHMELYRLMMYLARHKRKRADAEVADSPENAFTRCVQIIHQEYDTPLSAKVLAQRVQVSEPTVYRMFQKYLGISLTNYLNSIRVSAACGFLEKTDFSVTEIAERCGFSSLSNFYRVFRLYRGQAPKEYRKKGGSIQQKIGGTQQNIMDLNQFQGIWELPYTRDDLLIN